MTAKSALQHGSETWVLCQEIKKKSKSIWNEVYTTLRYTTEGEKELELPA
jgi:hypothetical protein